MRSKKKSKANSQAKIDAFYPLKDSGIPTQPSALQQLKQLVEGHAEKVKQQQQGDNNVCHPYVLVAEHGRYENIVGAYHSEFTEETSCSSIHEAVIKANELIHKKTLKYVAGQFQTVADYWDSPPDNGVLVRMADQLGETFAVHIRNSFAGSSSTVFEPVESDSTRQSGESETDDDNRHVSPNFYASSSGDAKQLYILSTEKGQWDPHSGIYHPKFEVVAVYDNQEDAVQNSAKFISNKSWEDQPHMFQQIRDIRKAPPAIGALIKIVDLDWNIEAVSITTKYMNDVKKVQTARTRNHPSMRKLNGYVLSTEYVCFDKEANKFEQESERRAFFHTKHEAIQCAEEYMSSEDWQNNPQKFQQIEDYRQNSPENGVLIRTVNSHGEINAVHIYYQAGDQSQPHKNTNLFSIEQNRTPQNANLYSSNKSKPQKNANLISSSKSKPAQENKRKNTPQKYLVISDHGEYSAWTHTYYPDYELIGLFSSKTDAAKVSPEFMPNSMWLEEPDVFQDVQDNRENPPENGTLIKATDQENGVQAVYIRQYDEFDDDSIKEIKREFPQMKVPKRIPKFTIVYELLTYSGQQQGFFGFDYEDKLETESIYQSKEHLIRDSVKYIQKKSWNAPHKQFKEFIDNRKKKPDRGVLIRTVSQGGYVEAVHIQLQPTPDCIDLCGDTEDEEEY